MEAQIAARAYELYQSEGRPTGRALQHWLLAEREILGHQGNGPRANEAKAASEPGRVPFIVIPQSRVRAVERRGGLASASR